MVQCVVRCVVRRGPVTVAGSGMSEVEEFAELVAGATKRKVEKFDYASLVPNGAWKASEQKSPPC